MKIQGTDVKQNSKGFPFLQQVTGLISFQLVFHWSVFFASASPQAFPFPLHPLGARAIGTSAKDAGSTQQSSPSPAAKIKLEYWLH